MTWTPDQLRHSRGTYSCWLRIHPDSEVNILVGPYEDANEVCRIANLIENAETLRSVARYVVEGNPTYTRLARAVERCEGVTA